MSDTISKRTCLECGMLLDHPGEYHPFEFCVLVKAGQDPRRLYQDIAKRAAAAGEAARLQANLDDERRQHQFERNSHDITRDGVARLREALEGVRRIIQSAADYKEWEKVRSVLVSAEWACSEALSSHTEDTGIQKVRDQVRWFSERMESRLKVNDHKSGWDIEHCSLDFLSEQMDKKCRRFVDAYSFVRTHEQKIDLLADIANYAMMLADRNRTIPVITDGGEVVG